MCKRVTSNLLSVRHIKRQAWLILANAHVKKIALLTIVLTNINVDPIMFLITIILKLFSDVDLRALQRPCCSHWKSLVVDDRFCCSLVPCMQFDCRMRNDEIAGRSCHTKMLVKTTFKTVSRTIIAIAPLGCIPILHSPSTRDRSASGATNSKPMILEYPQTVTVAPMIQMASRFRSTNGARTTRTRSRRNSML
jgi:hypothetical protein